jgi:hypothetical protein
MNYNLRKNIKDLYFFGVFLSLTLLLFGFRFRKSPDAKPVRESIIYAIVRGYISGNMADRLVPLMKSRSHSGIFLDPVSASLLLDHFIEHKDYANAAQASFSLVFVGVIVATT